MTKYEYFNHMDTSRLCRICLKTGDNFRPLAIEQITVLQILVPELPTTMQTCQYCSHLANKLIAFVNQCRIADQTLRNSCVAISKWRPLHDISQSKVTIESFGVFEVDTLKTEELSVCGDEPAFVDENCVGEGLDDEHDDAEEDVPLALLNKDIDVQFGDQTLAYTADIKEELPQPIKTDLPDKCIKDKRLPKDKKKKRTKKKQRKSCEEDRKNANTSNERFSSRMVKETEEYLVVKLTKEEVRRELRERATSETYLRAPFKCAECAKGFNFDDVLRNHMERHSVENGPLQCDICFQYCPSAVSLRGHYKSHTTRYKCKVCGETRGARQHLLEHYAHKHTLAAVTHTCAQCPFVTNKRTVMQRHARTHCAAKLPCEQCGKMFKSVEALRVHTRRHDRASLAACPQCPKRFVHASVLARHVQAVHVHRDYYCVECDVQFSSPENMKNHFEKAKVHRDPSSYKHPCPECDAVLLTRATLSVHMCAVHGHARVHACASCPRAYGSRDALRGHERRVHRRAGAPPPRHRCTVCDKVFEQKCSLARHWKVHTGERAHACPQCPLRFAQSSTRDTHRALVHDKRPPRSGKRKAPAETEYKSRDVL